MFTFFSPAEFAGQRECLRKKLHQLGSTQAELLYVALNEAVNNAFIHGYEGETHTPIEVDISCENGQLTIRVRHQGRGITAPVSAGGEDELSWDDHGRGIAIMRQCTDLLTYSDDGREVFMYKRLG